MNPNLHTSKFEIYVVITKSIYQIIRLILIDNKYIVYLKVRLYGNIQARLICFATNISNNNNNNSKDIKHDSLMNFIRQTIVNKTPIILQHVHVSTMSDSTTL